MANRDPLMEELIHTDDEFGRLYREHQQHERRLEEIHGRGILLPEDEMEEKTIKRQKLRLKDRMHAILRNRTAESMSA